MIKPIVRGSLVAMNVTDGNLLAGQVLKASNPCLNVVTDGLCTTSASLCCHILWWTSRYCEPLEEMSANVLVLNHMLICSAMQEGRYHMLMVCFR